MVTVRVATPDDVALIFRFIRDLAEYEKLLSEVEASEADVRRDLFGPAPRVFCDIAEADGEPVGLALWFYNYSTFRGRHGIWLEDLFVKPDKRGVGAGKALRR
jgi:GNAT superfamily N-acetyltransferase